MSWSVTGNILAVSGGDNKVQNFLSKLAVDFKKNMRITVFDGKTASECAGLNFNRTLSDSLVIVCLAKQGNLLVPSLLPEVIMGYGVH